MQVIFFYIFRQYLNTLYLYFRNATNKKSCQKCDVIFNEYGTPALQLSLINNKIILKVKSYLKLKSFTESNRRFFCNVNGNGFYESEVEGLNKYTVIYNLLKRSNKEEIYRLYISNEDRILDIQCFGFAYPELNLVTSSKIVVFQAKDSIELVAKMTLSMTEYDLSKNPFILAEEQLKILTNLSETTLETRKISILQKNQHYSYNLENIHPINFDEVFENTKYISTTEINNKSCYHLSRPTTFRNYTNVTFEAFVHIYLKLNSSIMDIYTHLRNTLPKDVKLLIAGFCLKNNYKTERGNLTWEVTPIGQTVPSLELCYDEHNNIVTRNCEGDVFIGANWSEPSGNCSTFTKTELTKKLEEILFLNEAADETNKKLHFLLKQQKDASQVDVYLISQIIQKVAGKAEKINLKLLTESISSVIDFKRDTLSMAQSNLNASDRILHAYQEVLENQARNISEVLSFSTNNINVFLGDIYGKNSTAIVFHKNGIIENVDKIENLKHSSIELIAFITNLTNNKMQRVKVGIAAFKKPKLFNSIYKTATKEIGWVPNIFFQNLSFPIEEDFIKIWLKPFRNYRSQKSCAFWKYGVDEMGNSVKGKWIIESSPFAENNFQVCKFSHTTHFALILNIAEKKSINIISTIGSILSCFAILGIFISALIFKRWREALSTKILLNFSIAILMQIVLLSWAEVLDSYEQETECQIAAISLHYVIISQFFWMAFIGYLQYKRFILVFSKTKEHLYLQSLLIGWLFPLVPVIITYCGSPESYIMDEYCYLTGHALYFGIFLPISCVIALNLVMFTKIFIGLCCKKVQVYGTKKVSMFFLHVRLAVLLFFLMGFTWIFGLLSGFFKVPVLSYLFCITTSLQGTVLFVYHVILNKNIREMWKSLLRK